ncbi:hypothetical protein BOTBODRAFT_224637 [Botryobasidium botryosum FD-172 SS1]|uniref:DNA2/NAM7 helicase-like C-terminal domain-containing protein n=1 Tax=Botryobasidium botryosum (strain FD-172 SS1) TaxID=930990 RepID=A0A067MYT9_BOTB1|nr:hypothetical protein BOTBODRAFT_224637 [Botryobasidium botryosum FD-172 SS1]
MDYLGQMQHTFHALENIKPRSFANDFAGVAITEEDGVTVENSRFRTKIRPGRQTTVVFKYDNGHEIEGRAVSTAGRDTNVKISRNVSALGPVRDIQVVGREDPTPADTARTKFLLGFLHGSLDIEESEFIRQIYFPTKDDKAVAQRNRSPPSRGALFGAIDPRLNNAQASAARALLSPDSHEMVLVQGPPGTGKTRTIAAVIKAWEAYSMPAWVVAQSNVGVKRIAETLLEHQCKFLLIVSKEFHFGWHEHLYLEMEEHVIRTDELPEDLVAMERLLSDNLVILCTIDTLSNPTLHERHVFDLIPVERIVIDEASQIYVGAYVHILHSFRRTLQKICWFGDPKQLPPYGKESIDGLLSIFEVKHLRPGVYFLDTQYRMPEKIGNFISHNVYDSKLKSVHTIKDHSCVAFVDVDTGHEIQQGRSWANQAEIQVLVHLVGSYYRHADFCVITPYDAQRATIESTFKANNLPWEDRIFNVDSFQGNEAPIVLISIVRTTAAGFLKLMNRVNVMLTRCKTAMVILSSRRFLRETNASNTLIGLLAEEWEMHQPHTWIDWRRVAQGSVNLPGRLAPKPISAPTPVVVPRVQPSDVKQITKLLQSNLMIAPAPPRPPPVQVEGAAFPALASARSTKPRVALGVWSDPRGMGRVKGTALEQGHKEEHTIRNNATGSRGKKKAAK